MKLANPSFWDFDLYGPMEGLFLKICNRRVRVRFMRIWFRDFAFPARQLSLFDGPSALKEKQAAAIQALDRIREKHGEPVIKTAKTIPYGARYTAHGIKTR